MGIDTIDLFGELVIDRRASVLAERFIVPPFSVLSAREGWWQERKQKWLAMGIKSEIGRNAATGGSKKLAQYIGGERQTGLVTESDTSVFDPVLCEIIYKWFCPLGGAILDPFAGGSVRGIVASVLGYHYTGVDLRAEQIAANEAQMALAGALAPQWLCGDSRNITGIAPGAYDMVFSCPPYADLEVYSDDPRDLSTLKYSEFCAAYRQIIAASCAMLKPESFACFVVGDVRDRRGNYYGFVPDTARAFQDAGLHFYNEAILVTAAGSLPMRAGRAFESGRKLGKTHQNILVFVKGDGKRATARQGGGA